MPITFVYKGTVMSNKGTVIGNGNWNCIPRVGDFIDLKEHGGTIYSVSAVVFKIVSTTTTTVIIYLTDIMDKTEEKLRNY